MEDNKLIAEFMGYNIEEVNGDSYATLPDMLESLAIEELQYHSSWDCWLMPVVKKCLSMKMDSGISGTQGEYVYISDIEASLLACDIEETYLSTVEFIKWYNKQEKSNGN